jgi:hypothetical protein
VPGARLLQESLSMIALASKRQRSAPLAAYDVLINSCGNSAQEQEKERQMTTEAEINRNHSLGRLRPAQKTKPRSPDCIGKLHLKRDHLLIFLKQVEQSRVDEVTCNIAGWKGNDVYGPFMTIEISPRFEKRLASHNSDPFADFV